MITGAAFILRWPCFHSVTFKMIFFDIVRIISFSTNSSKKVSIVFRCPFSIIFLILSDCQLLLTIVNYWSTLSNVQINRFQVSPDLICCRHHKGRPFSSVTAISSWFHAINLRHPIITVWSFAVYILLSLVNFKTAVEIRDKNLRKGKYILQQIVLFLIFAKIRTRTLWGSTLPWWSLPAHHSSSPSLHHVPANRPITASHSRDRPIRSEETGNDPIEPPALPASGKLRWK